MEYHDEISEKTTSQNINNFNTIAELLASNCCKCGKYQISQQKPYKLLYTKVYSINKYKRISLCVYDWAIDQSYVLESFTDQEPFSFAISEDGKFVSFTENEGRNAKVLLLGQPGVYCNLWISRSLKSPLYNGFMTIQGKLWYTIIRHDGKSGGNMHLFKIEQKKEGEYIESQYKRAFNLFEKTLQEYRVSSKEIIYPYVENDAVYCLSVCGVVHEMIDYKRTGNHEKKNVENFVKWTEQD